MPTFVEDFEANPAREGPQIIISWTYPTGFSSDVDEIRLVRKRGSPSTIVTEGKVVFSSTSLTETEYADLDVLRGVCFYYTMFSKRKTDGLFIQDVTTQDEVVPYETGFSEDALWKKLPGIYQTSDAVTTDQTILTQETASALDAGVRAGSIFNFDESDFDSKGFLRRFLKIFGVEFDKFKETSEFFPTFFDLDETCAGFLPFIGDLLGVIPNFDLPVDRQRDEIRRAVSSYKVKGTESMLISLIAGITAIAPTIDLWHDNVLVTNTSSSTTYSFDPDDVSKQFLADDPNDYVASDDPNEHNFNKVAIFLDVSGEDMTQIEINKIRRTIPDFLPARIEAVLTFLASATERYSADVDEDTRDRVTLGDLYDAGNVIETSGDDEVFTVFLITNDEDRLTNSEFVTSVATT